jgi:biopolymer transport protein ExbD
MAFIDSGSGTHTRRALDRDLPLVPFIDFLLCLIAFLLVTAVWSQASRIDADAQLGRAAGPAPAARKMLHVELRDKKFELRWKQAGTVLSQVSVERKPIFTPDRQPRYPDLARAVAQEWQNLGAHRARSDQARDTAILHTTNSAEFAELVGVLDALNAPKREITRAGTTEQVSAFSVSLATD